MTFSDFCGYWLQLYETAILSLKMLCEFFKTVKEDMTAVLFGSHEVVSFLPSLWPDRQGLVTSRMPNASKSVSEL